MTRKGDRVIAVIPARYGSTRFPGKPLALIAGKTMIEQVYRRAAAATYVDKVLVATDDARIAAAVAGFGGDAVMTSSEHATGTDRIAEAMRGRDADWVLNVQGDEPTLPPSVLDDLVRAMASARCDMGTVAVPFGLTGRDPSDPNCVKVVVDGESRALYFSRAQVPFCRQGGTPVEPMLHWGLYAYRRDFLDKFVSWPRGQLETCEMLEQLRAVEKGVRILVVKASVPSVGVDVPADIPLVEEMLRREAKGAA
ncbi:MAG: hypothetical protein A3K19_15505 [Lentisphaerae bacterium RIFOXYB12_FULL_65_16]|nr:MAG: hypothetical protein A3K18_26440 [Lentisphaerae bacterium RIFOXYA12_64_32]OGV88514.1 MAG: hypothetical protein A3K19_15505 [Lentisphaerae bacterium RIFOXYB12_FULL_65_16]